MNILAMDTSGPVCGVCVLQDQTIRCEITVQNKLTHSANLMPMIRQALESAGMQLETLDKLAVVTGPGSFTGVRIGMATVKGLAQVWNKPVIEVPTLASFAYGEYDWLKSGKSLICPMFDARRSQVYSGVYEPGCKTPVVEDAAYGIEELMEKIRAVSSDFDYIVFFGDGIKVYKDHLPECGIPYEIARNEDLYQMASSVARLGEEIYREGDLKDCYTCQPEYLRLAEAERKLREKSNA